MRVVGRNECVKGTEPRGWGGTTPGDFGNVVPKCQVTEVRRGSSTFLTFGRTQGRGRSRRSQSGLTHSRSARHGYPSRLYCLRLRVTSVLPLYQRRGVTSDVRPRVSVGYLEVSTSLRTLFYLYTN